MYHGENAKFPRDGPGVPVGKCGIPREVCSAAERSTNWCILVYSIAQRNMVFAEALRNFAHSIAQLKLVHSRMEELDSFKRMDMLWVKTEATAGVVFP